MIRSACILSMLAVTAGCSGEAGFFTTRSATPVLEPQMAAFEMFEMDVSFDATVPFGTVARVCDAKGKPLGQLVGESAEGAYRIYDSGPDTMDLRKFYLTGLSDGCPRQFVAATALFGTPTKYEELHLAEGAPEFEYGATDAAYDDIKLRVCGAAHGETCGRKMKKLERDTLFVSAYDLTGETERWTDILIHDGSVVATALKTSATDAAD